MGRGEGLRGQAVEGGGFRGPGMWRGERFRGPGMGRGEVQGARQEEVYELCL